MRNYSLCQETCLLVVSHTINNSNASEDVSPSVKSPKVPQELGGLSFYETAGGVRLWGGGALYLGSEE